MPSARQRTAALVAGGMLAACAACAACGNTNTGSSAPGSAARSTSAAGSGTGSATGSGAVDLVVSDAVRAQLLAAGAAVHGLPASDYAGLVRGTTYYAEDRTTGDQWAGLSLVPSSGSYQAQVANQDDGAYLVLSRAPGGSWHGWETGMSATPGGSCPVTVPADVLAVWHWAPGSCDPPAGGSSGTTGSSAAGSASSAAGGVAPCSNADVDASLVGTASSSAQYELTLDLVNQGTSPCTMTGFPGFELVGPESDGSTTYDPVRQQVTYGTVSLQPGDAAHADFWALPGPDTCDDGQAWVPTSVSVTLPGGTQPQSLAWPGGSVDNCQGGATHPGTYIGPVTAGS